MRFKLQATEDIISGTGKAPSVYTHEFDCITLDEVLRETEQFLRGVGFFVYNIDYDTSLGCGDKHLK